jgi:hypothetical protein
MCVECFTRLNISTMYISLSNRLVATVVVFSLLLQGCRSGFQVNSEDFVLKKSSKTDNGAQVTDQASVPDAQPSILPDAPHSRLPIATTLSSVATSTAQFALSAHHLAVRPDTVPGRELASSTESEETDVKPASRSAAQVAECSSVGCLASLCASPFSVSIPVFGVQAWHQYFGEVGVAPSLPSDIDEILDSPCPFWPDRAVKETHLLVLIPSTVDDKAFTLDLLGELVQNPRRGGHRTQYFLYDDEIQRLSGDVYSSSSYWVLLTCDVLSGSRSKPYTVQRALVAARSSHVDDPPYAIPNVLEAATAVLSHYVRSGDRLYEETDDALPSTSTRCTVLLEDTVGHSSPVTVGRFCSRGLVFLSGFDDDAEFGVSCLRQFGTRHYRPSALLHSFGAEEWCRYFGEVEPTPPLPADIVDTLNSACPFWPGKVVKDTHLLVLIPAAVNGEPFSFNLLGELIQCPRGGGYPTKYDDYNSTVQKQFGAQSPARSYWVLMTRDVIEGSRNEDYSSQQALVAAHAKRTGLAYELPGALEAATAILSHYVRSGERLYTDDPWTYTRCQALVNNRYPVVVGGFAFGGLDIGFNLGSVGFSSSRGVASLRKF